MNHDTKGRFVAGNAAALTHGGRRALAAEEAQQTELYRRWEADLGGSAQLTAAKGAVLLLAVEAAQIAATAAAYLRRTGRRSLTSDRTQKAIETFLKASDRVYRGASILGLGRVEKAALDIHGYAAQKATESQS